MKDVNKRKVAHILAGVVLLVHAYEKWELHSNAASIFLFFGILILGIVVYHSKLHHKFPTLDKVFFVIEGFALMMIAFHHIFNSEKLWSLCYFLLSVAYFFMAFRKYFGLKSTVRQ